MSRMTQTRHVHVFLDTGDRHAAVILFQQHTRWQLYSWDLRRNTFVKGQWLTKAKLVLSACGVWKGLFKYEYRTVGRHLRYKEHTVISRVPYFTALLHYDSNCTCGMGLLRSRPGAQPRCAVTGARERLKEYVPADVLDWGGSEWKGWKHAVRLRGESMPRLDGPFLSTKGTEVGVLQGREVLLQHGKVNADGEVVVDWSDATFEHVAPPVEEDPAVRE